MKTGFRHALVVLIGGLATAVQGQSLIVVNQSNASISIIDPVTRAVTVSIDQQQPGRMRAHEVAVSLDGKTAYLPVYGDAGVGLPGADGQSMLLLDMPSQKITGAVDFGRGVRPHLPVVDPNSGLVYVTTELDNSIAVINPKTRTVIGSIPTGAEQSHMLVLSHDGRLGYTANVGPGSVSVLDMKARKTIAVIPVAQGVQRIAISADDRLVFTSDTKLPRLAVIDAAARSVRAYIPLPGLGYGAAATKDGRWLLIGVRGGTETDHVAVIDLKTMKVARSIAVGKGPQTIVIRPDDRVAYVSCARSGTVAVIDLTNWQMIATIPTAMGADGMTWAP
jgi:YVTN family beta-propeller protein